MMNEVRNFHAEPQSRRGDAARGRSQRATHFLARLARRCIPPRTDANPDAKKELRASAAPRESLPFSKHAQAGYTLMELLVVLAILGLLTSIGTVMVLRYLDSAKIGTANTEKATFAGALDLFKMDVGRYPTTDEGLEALVKAPPTAENWNGPYLKVTNLNDPWGHPFIYRSPGEHGEFDLYSYGPKGKEGAGDANPPIKNW
jgi:general secretion pathway protein G